MATVAIYRAPDRASLEEAEMWLAQLGCPAVQLALSVETGAAALFIFEKFQPPADVLSWLSAHGSMRIYESWDYRRQH